MMAIDNRERQMMIAMLEDAISGHTDATDPAVRAKAQAVLADLKAQVPNAPTAALPPTTVGREAGSAAANQYGTFAVHSATDRQVAFLKRLIAEKNTDGVKVPSIVDGISKKSCSALIDQLIDRPAKAGAAPVNLASDAQVRFVASLWSERDWAGVVRGLGVDTNKPVPTMTKAQASATIDALQVAPRKAAPAPTSKVVEIAAGAYRVDGRVIRVYFGQQSGQMLAQELVDATATTRDEAWKYLGKAARFVPADAHRMSVEECEQASAGTADHGWCCVCGRGLDDPKSVARGIGPVCRAKQG